jgi:hypothetical protein
MDPITIGIMSTVGLPTLNFVVKKIYEKVSGNKKSFFWQSQTQNMSALKRPVDFEEIKKRTRIVVVDDEDSFPVNLFKAEGYSIDKWDKVTDVSYGKLESGFYDIIVLDIKGIALDISQDDGLGVLENIKEKNPAQIIVAYSQHSFDLNKSRFWKLADETIAKPSDFLKIKGIIDTLINTKFKPERYIEALHQVLRQSGISEKEIQKLDEGLTKSIVKKEKPNWSKLLDFANSNADVVKRVATLGDTISKFFT